MKQYPFIDKAVKKPKIPKITEYKLHCQIAQYLDMVIKFPSRWHTVEVSNHGYGKAAMINQMMDKKKGVRTSWPDIEIIEVCDDGWGCNQVMRVIFLEVKIPGAKPTDKQEAFHAELRAEGHHVSVVTSVEDVEKVLKELGVI